MPLPAMFTFITAHGDMAFKFPTNKITSRGPQMLQKRSHHRARFVTVSAASNNTEQPSSAYVKVCGVTNVEDALLAASSGANLIGMILWPKAKRSIPPATAKEIAKIARQHGAYPVAVFVDEDAATICRVCEESDVEIAQLHGDGARSALADLPSSLKTVYVMHADKTGTVQTALPPIEVDWVLLDSLQGGSGERFDWSSLHPPRGRNGWLLAGGLTPDNVAEAIATAHPTGVDVSSGVCGPDGLKKDVAKVQQYVSEARGAYSDDVSYSK